MVVRPSVQSVTVGIPDQRVARMAPCLVKVRKQTEINDATAAPSVNINIDVAAVVFSPLVIKSGLDSIDSVRSASKLLPSSPSVLQQTMEVSDRHQVVPRTHPSGPLFPIDVVVVSVARAVSQGSPEVPISVVFPVTILINFSPIIRTFT